MFIEKLRHGMNMDPCAACTPSCARHTDAEDPGSKWLWLKLAFGSSMSSMTAFVIPTGSGSGSGYSQIWDHRT